MARDLADDVGRAAEAEEPDALGVAAKAQGAVADESRAQKRRLGDWVTGRQREGVARVGDDQLRVPAVERVAR